MKLYYWSYEKNLMKSNSLQKEMSQHDGCVKFFKHPEAAIKDYVSIVSDNGDKPGRIYVYELEINPYKAFNVSFKGEPIPWTKK